MRELKVHVLIRFNKKSGKVDTVMTSLGKAQLQIWALNHTPATKITYVIERDTGTIIFGVEGSKEGFPLVKRNIGYCEDFGIPFDAIAEIKHNSF